MKGGLDVIELMLFKRRFSSIKSTQFQQNSSEIKKHLNIVNYNDFPHQKYAAFAVYLNDFFQRVHIGEEC